MSDEHGLRPSSLTALNALSVPHAGKTVCAVDVCQDVNIRAQFSRLAWVSIGQEALIEELQETMMKQIADKSMPQGDEASTQQGRLKLLQDAVAAHGLDGHHRSDVDVAHLAHHRQRHDEL